AAGIHALRENVARLADDHRRARRLAELARAVPGVAAAEPETNIVMLDLDPALDPDGLVAGQAARGVRVTRFGARRLRAVTHLDVDDEGVEWSAAALREAVAEMGRGGAPSGSPGV